MIASLWANFQSVSWDCSNSSATCCFIEEVDCVARIRAGALTVFFGRELGCLDEGGAVLVRFRVALSWGWRGIVVRKVMAG